MNEEYIKTFMIDPSVPMETKSKDRIKAVFRGEDDEHFAARYSKVFHFQTINETKREKGESDHTNDVFFWRSEGARILMVSCSCIARLRCKHIVKAYDVYKTAIEAGFIEE